MDFPIGKNPSPPPLSGLTEILELRKKRKRVNYLSCIEGKGDMKGIHCIEQNAANYHLVYQ